MLKAFLLAAGKGERLKPLTDEIPKCLLSIEGKPLMIHWFELLKQNRIKEVLVNTSYLSQAIIDFVANTNHGLHIRITYEPELLGSAKTILMNRYFVRNDSVFYILYSDNYTTINLRKMLNYHMKYKPIATLGLFQPSNLKECGVVQMDKDNIIISIEEKPQEPKSKYAFAGIIIASFKIFNFINYRMTDIVTDLLPCLINRMRGYIINEPIIDIGTPDNYRKVKDGFNKV